MTASANNNGNPLNREFQSALRDNRIPPCPIALERIAEEMNRNEPDFRHLNQIISSDVALAASVSRRHQYKNIPAPLTIAARAEDCPMLLAAGLMMHRCAIVR